MYSPAHLLHGALARHLIHLQVEAGSGNKHAKHALDSMGISHTTPITFNVTTKTIDIGQVQIQTRNV